MSTPSTAVALFRSLRADRYVDTVTITDLTTRGTWNRTTKVYDTPATTTVYTGGALIRPGGLGITDRGETGETRADLLVYLPHTAHGILPGHQVTVDAIHSLGDDDLLSEVFTVQSVQDDTYDTHKLVKCKLSQGGGDRG